MHFPERTYLPHVPTWHVLLAATLLLSPSLLRLCIMQPHDWHRYSRFYVLLPVKLARARMNKSAGRGLNCAPGKHANNSEDKCGRRVARMRGTSARRAQVLNLYWQREASDSLRVMKSHLWTFWPSFIRLFKTLVCFSDSATGYMAVLFTLHSDAVYGLDRNIFISNFSFV